MSIYPDGGNTKLPSLDSKLTQDEISTDLTMCGLLVDKAEEMAKLYATHQDWTTVENTWFEERRDERSTRGSSRKIYRGLSTRFKTADSSLPSISRLPSVFNQCETERDKAQILYFYLIEDDSLVQYTVHQYVQRLQQSGVNVLNYDQETIERLLNDFTYADGSGYDYADSTTRRWGEGLRSVMRDIGALETQQTVEGQVPNIGQIPLLVASGYSWEKQRKEWLAQPTGWLYLFQPEQYWDSLAERLSDHPSWEASGLHGELRLQPVDGTYDWAEPWENDI